MRKRLALLVAILLSIPIWAEDETLVPTGDNDTDMGANVIGAASDSCGSACTSIDCYAYIDEDPESTEDDYYVTGSVHDEAAVFTMPPPTNPPSQGTDAQRINMVLSECDENCAEGSAPIRTQFQIDLWCNGSQIKTLWGPLEIRSDYLDEFYSFTWTFGGTGEGCADDGSDVEFDTHIIRSVKGSNESQTCYESLEWEVTWAADEAGQVIVVGKNGDEPPISIQPADTQNAIGRWSKPASALALWNEE